MNNLKINRVYFGDNIDVLKKFPDNSVDLIYIDPPFWSNRDYDMSFESGTNLIAYSDRWELGLDTYLPYMKERINEIHRILKKTGTFYLHCDHHASHYLKITCDEIFGINNFRNEIVWNYSGGGIPKKDFPRKHDVILRYTKTSDYTFNIEYKSYSEASKKVGKHQNGSDLRKKGTPITDWWDDIKPLSGFVGSHEKTGFKSQKPSALLNRIIRISSNENDIVLDAFCGSGTTLVSAKKLNRKWIGIDNQIESCKLSCSQLKEKEWIIVNYPYTTKTIHILKPLEFQFWVVNDKLHGRDYGNDRDGIDGEIHNFFNTYTNHGEYIKGRIGIQVKFTKVSRSDISVFFNAIKSQKRYNQNVGIIVGYSNNGNSGFSKDSKIEMKRLRDEENFNMIFIDAFIWTLDYKKLTSFIKEHDKKALKKLKIKKIISKEKTLFDFQS